MDEIKKASILLDEILPDLIREIATNSKVVQFQENPDFLEERLVKWHQFGLLTHTRNVKRAFYEEAPKLINSWGLENKLKERLNQKVSESTKYELFDISITLHDLGKIICYYNSSKNRCHEEESANLIKYFEKRLINLGLSPNSITKITRYIKTHDVVGKEIRDNLTETGKFSFSRLLESSTKHLCQKIAKKYSDVDLEIGFYFLCDSLGKTDLRINAKEDLDILSSKESVIKIIKQRNLNQKIIYAANQLPLNVKLAEVYLNSL
ncbi:MAG: hypothetical protein AABW67_02795 [Nanoarchaeota archaeon]